MLLDPSSVLTVQSVSRDPVAEGQIRAKDGDETFGGVDNSRQSNATVTDWLTAIKDDNYISTSDRTSEAAHQQPVAVMSSCLAVRKDLRVSAYCVTKDDRLHALFVGHISASVAASILQPDLDATARATDSVRSNADVSLQIGYLADPQLIRIGAEIGGLPVPQDSAQIRWPIARLTKRVDPLEPKLGRLQRRPVSRR
jgi:hypothetical protein